MLLLVVALSVMLTPATGILVLIAAVGPAQAGEAEDIYPAMYHAGLEPLAIINAFHNAAATRPSS